MEDQWWQKHQKEQGGEEETYLATQTFCYYLNVTEKKEIKIFSASRQQRETENSAVNTRTIHCAAENSFHEAYYSVFHEAYYFIYLCMLEQTLFSKCVTKQYLFLIGQAQCLQQTVSVYLPVYSLSLFPQNINVKVGCNNLKFLEYYMYQKPSCLHCFFFAVFSKQQKGVVCSVGYPLYLLNNHQKKIYYLKKILPGRKIKYRND